MHDSQSRDYFHRRAEEERTAAEQAADDRAAPSHRDLADRYDELATGESGATAPPEETGVVLPREFRILP